MKLADTRLGDVHHQRDFLQVHVLLVIHAHDELLSLRQELDCRHQGLAQALVAQQVQGIGVAVGHMAVEKAVIVVVAAPHILQVNQLGAAHFAQQQLVVAQAHAHFCGNFALQRGTTQAVFKPVQGLLDVFLAFARAARHPVVLPQFVQHGAANALSGKGFKLCALAGLIAGQGV